MCVPPKPWDTVPAWGQATPARPGCPGGAVGPVCQLCVLWVLRLVFVALFNLIFFPGFCVVFVVSGINGVFSLPGPYLAPIPAVPPSPRRCLLVPRLEPDILLRAKQDFLKIDSATDLQ